MVLFLFPVIYNSILPNLLSEQDYEIIEDWYVYKDVMYPLMFVCAAILIIAILKNLYCHSSKCGATDCKPFFRMYIMSEQNSVDYEMNIKDYTDNMQVKRVPHIEVFIHSDEEDYNKFKTRKSKIEELNQIKQEKYEFEQQIKNNKDAKKTDSKEVESKVLKDFDIKISSLNIDVHMHHKGFFKTVIFKIENMGNIAEFIRFYSKHVTDPTKQECIISGEERNQLMTFKRDQVNFFRVMFIKEKIKGNLKFVLVYKDMNGKYYSQDVLVPNIYDNYVKVEPPVRIKPPLERKPEVIRQPRQRLF